MSLIEVHFFFENIQVQSIKCSMNYSINEFISKVKTKKDIEEEIKFAYLKGHKLEGKDLLGNNLDDLNLCPIFLTNDPNKSYEYNIPHSNICLDDYENIEYTKLIISIIVLFTAHLKDKLMFKQISSQ